MKVLIIDDHKLFSEGIKQVLEGMYDNVIVKIADSMHSGLQCARKMSPDLTLLDWYLPDSAGVESLRYYIEEIKNQSVLVLSATDDIAIITLAIDAGAKGFVCKSATLSQLKQALKDVLAGKVVLPESAARLNDCCSSEERYQFDSYTKSQLVMRYRLTRRQLSVLSLIIQGMTNRQIADVLDCTEGTVKVHVSTILKSIGVKNRTEAVWVVDQLNRTKLSMILPNTA